MDTRLTQAFGQGQRDAFTKYALPIPEGLRSQLTLPKATMLAGAGAGIWDMTHGRGMGGSLGTAIGTGGGGFLGRWGGQALASRYGVNPMVGQLAGAGLGALLGRAVSKAPPRPEQPYAATY